MDFIGKRHRHIDFRLILRLICSIPHPLFRLPKLYRGQSVVPCQFLCVVYNTVLVAELSGFKGTVLQLVAEHKPHPLIDNSLPLDAVQIVLHRHVNIGKHLNVRLPTNPSTGVLLFVRLLLQAALVFAVGKVEGVVHPVPPNVYVHVLRRILGGTKTQAVQAQRILVAFVGIVVVLAAGVQLTEYQLPIIPTFIGVKVHRDASPKVLYLHGTIVVACNKNAIAVALSGFVDGVGENLKNRMFAALQSVGAKNNRRAFPHTVCAL